MLQRKDLPMSFVTFAYTEDQIRSPAFSLPSLINIVQSFTRNVCQFESGVQPVNCFSFFFLILIANFANYNTTKTLITLKRVNLK